MSKEKFTNGPWNEKAGRFGDIDLFSYENLVATVSCETIPDDVCAKNAALIAAAPEMYEILSDIWITGIVNDQAIEKLLAKARGEQ